jgi:hypothetical protein
MFNKKRLVLLLIIVLAGFTNSTFSVVKQHYGGNARVSEELLSAVQQIQLFEQTGDDLKFKLKFPFRIENNKLVISLEGLPADRISELEKVNQSIQDENHSCHWILDYPYFDHRHATSIDLIKDQWIIETEEPEYLQLIAQSQCLVPEKVSFLAAFQKTQFGYEANSGSILGRPFLDSISPAVVDPINPYLSFKLNEVDVFVVPEEKFTQIASDPQIVTLPGPRFYVYLRTENLSPDQVLNLTSGLDLREISRTVLNDHAQIYLPQQEGVARKTWMTPVYLKVPEEAPFELLGNRLRIQLEKAGFVISTKALPKNAPSIEIAAQPVREADLDFFRYRLMREQFQIYSDASWFEEWDEMEASGKIVPLMLYESRLAVRKNLIDVHAGPGGLPDFSDAWILPPDIPDTRGTHTSSTKFNTSDY